MSFKDLFFKIYHTFNDNKNVEYHALQIFVRLDDPFVGLFTLSRTLPGQLYVPKSSQKNLSQKLKDHYC